MSQKLTKNLKNPVKELKERIKALEKSRDRWENDFCEARAEIEKRDEVIKTFKDLRNEAIGGRTDALEREITHLQEIIKWLIKPSTTGAKKTKDFNRLCPPFAIGGGSA